MINSSQLSFILDQRSSLTPRSHTQVMDLKVWPPCHDVIFYALNLYNFFFYYVYEESITQNNVDLETLYFLLLSFIYD